MNKISQPHRLIIWIIYLLALLGVSWFLFKSPIPPTAEQGLWFYSCLASIVLGELITSPYFTSPADVISNSIAAIISLLAVNAWTLNLQEFNKVLWTVVISFNILILLLSIVLIVIKNSSKPNVSRLSKVFFVFSSMLGNHRVVFSTVMLYALISFHIQKPVECITISLTWVLLIAIHPIEKLWNIANRIRDIYSQPISETVGQVVGYEFPNIILVKHQPNTILTFGDPIVVQGDNGQGALGCALDQIGFTGELWHRVLRFPAECQPDQDQLKSINGHNAQGVFKYEVDPNVNRNIQDQIDRVSKLLIGIVAPDSDVMKLKIELVRTDVDLYEGRLVEVVIGTDTVLFQIVNGLTREEIVEQRNSRGYVRAEARKLGKWDNDNFRSVKWVPLPNTPVYLVNIEEPPFDMNSIGFIPFTNYHISMDLNFLVTHNTAILGILGVGKTCLALELIERMIAQRIKVISLDLTNQYITELSPYFDLDACTEEIGALQAIGVRGRNQVNLNVEEGGSIVQFRAELKNRLAAFLRSENPREMLRVYNPAGFEVWRQDSRAYQNTAAMATLTHCEITRLISETTLEILQEIGLSNTARCCLIFEEAHSLVPEWNSVANEGDKTATNGTAKAILQGRKYGLGCLLITQRTANVTKSILNQCNTVFALRTFDSTGVDFLKNFVGDDYAGILSNLEDRHAVVFGKASSCNTPVMVCLNDREIFLDQFRPGVIEANEVDEFDEAEVDQDNDEEIPF